MTSTIRTLDIQVFGYIVFNFINYLILNVLKIILRRPSGKTRKNTMNTNLNERYSKIICNI